MPCPLLYSNTFCRYVLTHRRLWGAYRVPSLGSESLRSWKEHASPLLPAFCISYLQSSPSPRRSALHRLRKPQRWTLRPRAGTQSEGSRYCVRVPRAAGSQGPGRDLAVPSKKQLKTSRSPSESRPPLCALRPEDLLRINKTYKVSCSPGWATSAVTPSADQPGPEPRALAVSYRDTGRQAHGAPHPSCTRDAVSPWPRSRARGSGWGWGASSSVVSLTRAPGTREQPTNNPPSRGEVVSNHHFLLGGHLSQASAGVAFLPTRPAA